MTVADEPIIGLPAAIAATCPKCSAGGEPPSVGVSDAEGPNADVLIWRVPWGRPCHACHGTSEF